MPHPCIFCDIANGHARFHPVWSDDSHLSFDGPRADDEVLAALATRIRSA